MEILIKAEALSAFGRILAGEMECPTIFASVAPRRAFLGGELEVVFAQVFEGRSYRRDVGRRVRVENDHSTEVGRHLCQTFNDFVKHLDEPTGRSTPALGHDEPLVAVRGGVKRRERNGVLVRSNLVEQGDRIEEGKHPSVPQGVEDWPREE